MAAQADDKAVLTVKEAAALLGVSPNTLRAWGAAGNIWEGRHPVNNYRLYRLKDVEDLRKRIDAAIEPKRKTTAIRNC